MAPVVHTLGNHQPGLTISMYGNPTKSGNLVFFLCFFFRPLQTRTRTPLDGWRGCLGVIWSWGGLETARGRVGKVGDCFGEVFGGFRGKSRWSFRTFLKTNRVHVGPKSFSRTFSIHSRGFRAQNKANIFIVFFFSGSFFFFPRIFLNSIPTSN